MKWLTRFVVLVLALGIAAAQTKKTEKTDAQIRQEIARIEEMGGAASQSALEYMKERLVARLAEDKAVDIRPARSDLGFDPRPFAEGIRAEAAMLT